MQLKSAIKYDKSLGDLTGKITLPKLNKEATHALVFMIKGISSPWKQVVLWHLTGNSIPGSILYSQIVDVVKCLENIGLEVLALVSDMGPTNTSLWKHMGISVTRVHRIHYVNHPARHNAKLYVFADPQHVLKNIRNALLKHDIVLSVNIDQNRSESIPLPSEFVECDYEGHYSTNIASDSGITTAQYLNSISSGANQTVKMQYFHDILTVQIQNDILLAPKLTLTHLNPDQHKKMNVRLAFQLLHHDTAAALTALIKLGYISEEATTTAWFCKLIAEWFGIISSRNKKQSLTKHWVMDYGKKLHLLHQTIDTFATMSVGKRWMPFQSGLIMTTLSYLAVSDELFSVGFGYVLGGRFSQDAVENLFSLIRSRGDRFPTALRFRANLRNISVSQYFAEVKSSSYMHGNDEYFVDLIKTRQKRKIKTKTNKSAMSINASYNQNFPKDSVCSEEEDVFNEQNLLLANAEHRLFGYVLSTIKHRLCDNCWVYCVDKSQKSANTKIYFTELNKGGMVIHALK